MINKHGFDVRYNKVSPLDIVDVCCSYFGVEKEYVFTRSRKSEKVMVRQIMQYLMHSYTTMTLVDIAEYFKFHGSIGNHSTVIHSIKNVKDRMEYERVYKDDIKKIERILGIDRRDYLNSGSFMRMDRGQKTTLHYETDNGVKEVVYKHKMIERRDGVVYAIGFFKNENEAWEIKEDAIYEERLSMIMSDNGEKIFIER